MKISPQKNRSSRVPSARSINAPDPAAAKTRRAPGGRRLRRAFTLVEVMFALFIFVMMALMFSAVIPTAARSSKFGNSYIQAATIAQHKVDQLQAAGYTQVYGAGAALQGLNITENAGTTTGTAPNATLTASFTTEDNLLSYFPAGATGTIVITPWAPSWNAARSEYTILQAVVTVRWRDATRQQSEYKMSTLLTKTPQS